MNKLLTIFGLTLVLLLISHGPLIETSLALLPGVGVWATDTADTAESSAVSSESGERCAERRGLADAADATVSTPRSAPAPRSRPARAGGSWQSLLPGSIR